MSKMTVGKALDMLSLGGPAAYRVALYMEDGNINQIKAAIPEMYTGYNPVLKQMIPKSLAWGYGGAVSRVVEKKVFKALGIRAPRTKMENLGDVIDYVSYFGKTAMEFYENKDNMPEAIRQGYKTQYGIDLGAQNGLEAVQPLDMITEKWAPYVFQKYIRKILRGAGVKMPSFKFGS